MRKILVLLTLALASQAFGYNGINRLQLIEIAIAAKSLAPLGHDLPLILAIYQEKFLS